MKNKTKILAAITAVLISLFHLNAYSFDFKWEDNDTGRILNINYGEELIVTYIFDNKGKLKGKKFTGLEFFHPEMNDVLITPSEENKAKKEVYKNGVGCELASKVYIPDIMTEIDSYFENLSSLFRGKKETARKNLRTLFNIPEEIKIGDPADIHKMLLLEIIFEWITYQKNYLASEAGILSINTDILNKSGINIEGNSNQKTAAAGFINDLININKKFPVSYQSPHIYEQENVEKTITILKTKIIEQVDDIYEIDWTAFKNAENSLLIAPLTLPMNEEIITAKRLVKKSAFDIKERNRGLGETILSILNANHFFFVPSDKIPGLIAAAMVNYEGEFVPIYISETFIKNYENRSILAEGLKERNNERIIDLLQNTNIPVSSFILAHEFAHRATFNGKFENTPGYSLANAKCPAITDKNRWINFYRQKLLKQELLDAVTAWYGELEGNPQNREKWPSWLLKRAGELIPKHILNGKKNSLFVKWTNQITPYNPSSAWTKNENMADGDAVDRLLTTDY